MLEYRKLIKILTSKKIYKTGYLSQAHTYVTTIFETDYSVNKQRKFAHSRRFLFILIEYFNH